jgi:hypothetical protein
MAQPQSLDPQGLGPQNITHIGPSLMPRALLGPQKPITDDTCIIWPTLTLVLKMKLS